MKTPVKFQADASVCGRNFEDRVVAYLQDEGFEIIGRNVRHPSGIEFDILIRNSFDEKVAVECKASPDDATQPGMVRSDNRWKVMGHLKALDQWAHRTGERHRYLLVTTHMPPPGSQQRITLDRAVINGDCSILVLPNGPQQERMVYDLGET